VVSGQWSVVSDVDVDVDVDVDAEDGLHWLQSKVEVIIAFNNRKMHTDSRSAHATKCNNITKPRKH
jgi:hypothetical protein